MNHYLGWRSIFYLTAVLGVGAAARIKSRIREEYQGAPGEKYDTVGSIFYMLGMLAFLYGLSSILNVHWSRYILLLGIILLMGFIAWELKTDAPILQVRLFKNNRGFAFSNLAAMINYSATFAVTFLLSIYLQVVRGYSSQEAGFVLLAQPLLMALLSPLAGRISDRKDPRLVASSGMAFSALSLFALIFLKVDSSLLHLIAALIVGGLGFAVFASPNTNAVMSSVQPRLYGIASSTLGTMRLVGQAVSMSLVTLLIALFIGHIPLASASPEVFLRCMRVSFTVFTVLCLLGIAASLTGRAAAHKQTSGG